MDDPIVKQFLDRCASLGGKIRAVYVFGSRARGTARPDSDYDLLIVVSTGFSLHDKDVLYDIVMDILLQTGRLVSLKIFPERVFQQLCDMQTPFMVHVRKEGIKVG